MLFSWLRRPWHRLFNRNHTDDDPRRMALVWLTNKPLWECPRLGVNQTLVGDAAMSAFGTKRTFQHDFWG